MRIFLFALGLCLASGSAGQEWESMGGSNIQARHHPVTFTLQDTAYLLTGTTAQSSPVGTNDFFRYDEAAEEWVELDPFPGGARSYSYAVTEGGKAYVGFGTNDFSVYFKDLWEYDPSTKKWTRLNDCECIGRTHPAFVAHDGKVYVGLGGSANGDLNDWWEYDIATDQWTERDPIPGRARHHPFHFQAGDALYAGMGHNGGFYLDDWYKYDPATQEWTQMQDHPGGPRVAGQEFSYDGYGYVISGDGGSHQNLRDGEFWKYLHETDEWERLPDHPGNPPDGRVGRWAPGAFVLNGYAYFFGGENRGSGFLYSDLHRYDLRESVSAVSQVKERPLQLYPNPAQDYILVKTALESEGYKIYDNQGRLRQSGKVTGEQMVRLQPGLSPGRYYFHLGNTSRPFIIMNGREG